MLKMFCALISIFWLSATAAAHQMSLLELELNQLTERSYELALRGNVSTTQPLIRPGIPEQCEYDRDVFALQLGQAVSFHCEQNSFAIVDQLTLRWNVNAVHLTSRWLDGAFNQTLAYADEENTIAIALHTLATEKDSWLSLSLQYGSLGAEHLAGGYDHLLFVLGMCLLLGWHRKLIYSVTAFTIAHSVTLAITYFGLLQLNAPPVEACIALSIAVLAAEVIRKQQGFLGLTARYPALMCGAIGLLHGLGFAGALADIGVSDDAVVPALFGFNLGLEIAQLAFIGILFSSKWLGQKLLGQFFETIAYIASIKNLFAYGIGSIALFWTLQRVLG